MKRRRFIQISALASPALAVSCERVKGLKRDKPQEFKWQGIIFGAQAEITFKQVTKAEAQVLIPTLTAEVSRLENLFSLYNPSSLLSLLNLTGKVHATAFEFKELIGTALGISTQTEGLFDPTIQSYWMALRESHQKGSPLTLEQRRAALSLVDYRKVQNDGLEVKYAEAGMAMTLNGIAQGYITDKIHALLSDYGFTNILINLGEYRALGNREDAKPWKIHLREEGRFGKLAGEILELSDGVALAVSSGAGYRFSATGKDHHLINPHDGSCYDASRTIAIQAPDATTADALATACSVTSPEKAAALIERFPGCILLTDTMVS